MGKVKDMLIGGFVMICIIAAYKYMLVDKFQIPVISDIIDKA